SDVDYAVVISEIGNERNLNPENSWLSSVPTLFTEEARDLGVDTAIMSISQPYVTANYPAAKGVLALFGAKGMAPTEGLRPDKAFGPNIPAGIEIIFGKEFANGRLPVDLPKLDQNQELTDTIAFRIGQGYTLNEAAKAMSLEIPDSAKVDEKFDATVKIDPVDGITDEDYQLKVHIDTENFELGEIEDPIISIEGNVITIDKEAGDTSDVKIPLIARKEGSDVAPILRIDLIDINDRVFTLGDDVFAKQVMDIMEYTEV